MRDREKGSATALVALMLPIMFAGLGLAIDGGHAYDLKRRLQKTADAAALAAAQELRRGHADDYAAAALRDAGRNGFTTSNAIFEILHPPLTGPRQGDQSFVQVRVRSESPAYFMRLFAGSQVTVEAMAVAGVLPSDKCVYTLAPDAPRALWATGSASVNFGACGIQVNSDHHEAARTNGGATVFASSIDVVGDYSGTGFSPTPLSGATVQDDPWADLPAPSVGPCSTGATNSLVLGPRNAGENSAKSGNGGNNGGEGDGNAGNNGNNANTGTVVHGDQTLSPGVYCGGITVSANAHAILEPGTYVLYGGGLQVNGAGSISGDGVTFYNTEGAGYAYDSVDFHGTSTARLSAPTSGPTTGILFFQDRDVVSNRVNNFAGTAATSFAGGLYFKTTDVKFTGSAGMATQKLMIVARTVEFHGTVDVTAPDVATGFESPHILRASLVY